MEDGVNSDEKRSPKEAAVGQEKRRRKKRK
jgi:hypothetical protein